MKIELPEQVKEIIKKLEENGYEAYAVGGCVRDSLLGRRPEDWDITTSASPLEVKSLFSRTIDTGISHGTVTVMLGKTGYEVTTYRIDGKYEDNRHPKEVRFTGDLTEDLKRRDFTINAMAYNERAGIVDCFDGIKDIERKKIRCVGDPAARFNEDALRILRAVRFSAQLGFSIEEETKKAIGHLASNLKAVSAERIQAELLKLLISDAPEKLLTAYETGITAVIFPEFDQMMKTPQHNPHHQYNVGEHTIKAVCEARADKALRLAMLLHDVGKPACRTTGADFTDHFYGHAKISADIAKKFLKRLKFDNETTDKVVRLVYWHSIEVEPVRKSVRRSIHKVGEDIYPDLLEVKRADAMAKSTAGRTEKLLKLQRLQELYREVIAEGDCISLKDLKITGNDLIENGMHQGKEIGIMLNRLLELVLEAPEKNHKEYLLKYVKELSEK